MLKRIVTVFLAALLVANMTLTVCLPAEAISQTVSKTTTVSKKAALKITKQPVSVTKPSGVTSKVSVTASGDGLTYTWYVKNAGATKFTVSSVKTNTYSVKMSSSNANRQVYCVVKDKYGKSVKTNTVTLKMGKTLTITKQLASVTAHENYMATVSFVASGDALSYAWYVKNADATSFTLDKSVTGTKYSVTMTEAVKIINAAGKGIKTEASGNMSIPRLKEVASTGVDYISVGALTHTVKGMDISMNIQVE